MYVGSLPELHLMAFGWMLYDNFWSVLAFVGLVMFPFTWMVITTVFDAVKRHGFAGADAPIAAFHTVFPSFLLMMGIYAIAGLPTVRLDVQNWEYTKLCTANGTPQPQAPIMTPGNTGTPLDTAQQLASGALRPTDARVPILWDLLHRIGAGMSRALNSGGACPTHSNYLDKELRKMSFIGDPGLQAELGQFVKDCYLPARGRFMRAMQSGTLTTVPTPASATNPDQYFAARYRDWRGNPPPNQRVDEVFDRNDDPSYMGSRFFLTTPGLYAPAIPGQYDQQVSTLKASKAIAGWPYDPFRDCQRNNAAAGGFCTDPTRNSDMDNNYGSPTCDEWWANGTRGLRYKLVNAAERSSAIASGGFPLMQNGQPTTMGQALNQVITSTSGTPRSDNWMADKLIATTLANDTVTQESIMDKAMDILDQPIDGDDGEVTRGGGSNFLMETIVGAGTFIRSAPARAAVAINLAKNAVHFYTTAWVVKNAYP
ncbi:MAG: conjugal transfer protein TraG N-terminal domain-containing protein, partial [Steroidobacteraceae bacterium]